MSGKTMKINNFSAKRFFAKRIVFLGLLAISMSTIFVSCEKPNDNPDDEGVYYKLVYGDNENNQ